MQRGLRAGIRWTALICGSSLSLVGQTAGGSDPISSPTSRTSQEVSLSQSSGQVYREIDDPFTGDRWLLLRDDRHPGGPGRLVLATGSLDVQASSRSGREKAGSRSYTVMLLPVIRTGDRLIVERNTSVVEERLEAVALGPAVQGSSFEVRLEIGGKIFRAVALGPGQAVFAPEAGKQP
jgi:hypothetical protein